MKKMVFIIITIILIIGASIWWWKLENDKKRSGEITNNVSNYIAERSDTNQDINKENLNNSNTTNSNSSGINTKDNSELEIKNEISTLNKEVEIAQFSTKIYNKEAERQNNITITCKTISGKEVAKGEVFSFCNTVGKATSAKGYQEADIYVNGKKKKGLGGGNCQISTTLYNAILKVPELEVIERHQHSGKVPYIKDGKDAAVSYGVYDFKFKNNTNNTIKIIIENTSDNITAKLIRLE